MEGDRLSSNAWMLTSSPCFSAGSSLSVWTLFLSSSALGRSAACSGRLIGSRLGAVEVLVGSAGREEYSGRLVVVVALEASAKLADAK